MPQQNDKFPQNNTSIYALGIGLGLGIPALLGFLYYLFTRGFFAAKPRREQIQAALLDPLSEAATPDIQPSYLGHLEYERSIVLEQRLEKLRILEEPGTLVGDYTVVRRLSENERGKNPTAMLVSSESHRYPGKTKLWIAKSFYSTPQVSKYDLQHAALEVFIGQLLVTLFGKQRAAKTKFNPKQPGVVSRVVGDDFSKTMTLPMYLIKLAANKARFQLPSAAQQSFLQTILGGLILGSRDLRVDNLILKTDDQAPENFVYSIDNEVASQQKNVFNAPLSAILLMLYQNPQNIVRIFLDKKCEWNLKPFQYVLDDYRIKFNILWLGDFITRELFLQTLQSLADHLAADAFKAVHATRDKILAKMAQYKDTYSAAEIAHVVRPTIDTAIKELKTNVATVYFFLDGWKQQAMAHPKPAV